MQNARKACFHLPGLFEFYEFYRVFLPLYAAHPEYFYEHCCISSLYGAPADCLWGGGRAGYGEADPREAFALAREYGLSARLTFSNSLLQPEHLQDARCNELCRLAQQNGPVQSGVIVHSNLLADYMQKHYPGLYLVSSTTKVLTSFSAFRAETENPAFSYVVPDFRLNKAFAQLSALPQPLKDKTEFLCNECCYIGCQRRKECYVEVSRRSLGLPDSGHRCGAPGAEEGYRFSKAMQSPAFISTEDIQKVYLPMGFSQFKIEGRSLGSALILEFLLHYLTRPEYQLTVREEIYLENTLDLF